MIECTVNNDKNIYWPPLSRGHYRECMARTYVGTFSLCRCQKEYYETTFSGLVKKLEFKKLDFCNQVF